jgi:hypothetical protein
VTARHNILQLTAIAAVLLTICGRAACAATTPPGEAPAARLADVRLGDHAGFTRLVFAFEPAADGAPTIDQLPRFKMRYRRYPYRLELDLLGVAAARADFPGASADRSPVVTAVGIYPAVPGGNITKAVICVAGPTRYRIRILPDPCRLIVDLRPSRRDSPPSKVWAVRVNTRVPDLRRFEALGVDPAWPYQLPDAAGGVAVEGGAFSDRDAAYRRAGALAALGISTTVVSRGAADLPAPWPAPATASG